MAFTIRQLTKRYGPIVAKIDREAPNAARRDASLVALRDLDAEIARLQKSRAELAAWLQRRRVSLVSGRKGGAAGIVVGHGDTQAEALADAATRLGKAS